VSSFSAQWLALREPLDAAARNASLVARLDETLSRGRAAGSRLNVVDLGAGTGANLRYVAPLLGGLQDWLLVEKDPLLLAAMPPRQMRGVNYECRVSTLPLDLATQLEQVPLTAGTLVTASALLDLVSAQWLRSLAQAAAASDCSVCFALTYDGRIGCEPAEPEDGQVRELVNRHQRNDKGFGAALGPAAARTAERIFTDCGYHVHCAVSDWHIGTEHRALQHDLIEGWCRAASDAAPERAATVRDWSLRRHAHVDAVRSVLRVGHVDMIGVR